MPRPLSYSLTSNLFFIKDYVNCSFPFIEDSIKNDIIRSREGESCSAFSKQIFPVVASSVNGDHSLGIGIGVLCSAYNGIIIETVYLHSL